MALNDLVLLLVARCGQTKTIQLTVTAMDSRLLWLFSNKQAEIRMHSGPLPGDAVA
jgi:hypothetical protein